MTSLNLAHLSWEPLSLAENQVHVWYADLDIELHELNRLESTLAFEERVRASRFHLLKDRRRFISGRAILRQILSRYLNRDARALKFVYGSCGKPFLRPYSGGPDLRFNLAHSQGMALYGITRNRDVGVDLERIDQSFADQQIAERFFSRRECSTLRTLPASQRTDAFFNCWTRKEAYVKAHGTGLQMPLDSFDVSLIPGQPTELLNGATGTWSIYAPKLAPGYAAAIVAEGSDFDLQTWEWKPASRRTNAAPSHLAQCGSSSSVLVQ